MSSISSVIGILYIATQTRSAPRDAYNAKSGMRVGDGWAMAEEVTMRPASLPEAS
jgi:hypothetical protein